MSAHTPGPWTVKRNPMRLAIRDARGYYIAEDVRRQPDDNGDSERNANARLIAAAPELLAALKAAILEIDINHDSIGAAVDVLESQGRAAIAKAEGR